MKAILILIFALALGHTLSVSAANLPSLGDALQPSTKNESTASLEPSALPANWWRYFDVKGDEFDRRVRETRQRLQTLLNELPKETAEAARPIVESIENNLEALAQAREEPSPNLPLPREYKKSHTVLQWLDIVERLHELQAELQAARNELASSEKAIESASQGVDTQLAAYLGLSPTDPRRILSGLKIMADRSAVAVAQERLRVRKAALAALEAQFKQLADEQTTAVQRLVADRNDLDRRNARIEHAQSMLDRIQERLIEQQTTTLKIAADRMKKMDLPYHQQQVVNTKVEEAIARVRLVRARAERQLVLLLLDTPVVDARGLRGMLVAWKAQLADIRKEALGWTRTSEEERNRASEAIASGATVGRGSVTHFGAFYLDRLTLAQQTLAALQRLEDMIPPVEVLIQVVDIKLVQREGSLRDWLARSELAVQQLWNTVVEKMGRSLFKIGDTPVTTLGLLWLVFILIIAWLISFWFRHVLARFARGHEDVFTQSALFTIGRLFHYSVITLGFIIGLASIGIDFTNFALVAGAIGIGIGFGLQSIVNNFVSGLILLFERTLKVGDFVEFDSGVAGEVRAINVRSTLINTNDNVDIVVPNSKFINHNVINWTLMETHRRIHVPFRVAYGTDIERVTQAALEAADQVPHTLHTLKPSVWLADFGESSLDYELVVWITPEAVKRPGAVHAAYKREISLALRRHGIEIPVPQRDVRLRSGFGEFIRHDPGTPKND